MGGMGKGKPEPCGLDLSAELYYYHEQVTTTNDGERIEQ